MSIIKLAALFAAWNLVVFLIYGLDKWKSERGWWRISEKTLLVLAFCMGSIGAFIGMRTFRHKTQHTNFKILVPSAIVFNFALMFLTWKFF